MLLGGDSSLDLEKVVFQAFYFLTSFALAGFHVDLCAFHGIHVFRSHCVISRPKRILTEPHAVCQPVVNSDLQGLARVSWTRERFLRLARRRSAFRNDVLGKITCNQNPQKKPNIKKAGVLLEINFHFFGMPASTPLVSSGLQRSSQARFANCWCQVHVALVPQALKFQRPSLGLWLADFGRELMKFQNWPPPILFLGLLCCFLFFFFFWGGGGRVNFREPS